jgi:hypothetical protein
MFADVPWVISPPAWIADYPAKYSEYWPAEKRLTRLHAMGYDAYHLVGELFNAREKPMEEIIGATGRLFLTTDGRVHRKPAWARFQRGVPVALAATDKFQNIFENRDADFDDLDDNDVQNGAIQIDRFPDTRPRTNPRNE